MTVDRPTALEGGWVHAHEEDTEDELVFRPATHPLPPSRGRASLELRADGSYEERAPGAADVPELSEGRWSLHGDRLVLDAPGGKGRTVEVASVAGDRLVLRKPKP